LTENRVISNPISGAQRLEIGLFALKKDVFVLKKALICTQKCCFYAENLPNCDPLSRSQSAFNCYNCVNRPGLRLRCSGMSSAPPNPA
jgi:hypothetical protein